MSRKPPPGVSVVMPVLNEERHLAAAVGGVLAQSYDGPLELVIALGPSSDATSAIARGLAEQDPRIRLVDNPTGRTPAALNHAIAAAAHPLVVRVDGHGELPEGYVSKAVAILLRTGAANVGGVMDAQGETDFEKAVAAAYNSRLGLGGSNFHLADSPEGPAETVFLGVFRKDALVAAGGFDETMHRAQDWELNHRLRLLGETVWFSPELKVTYRPRSSLRALARQFFSTGRWRREVIRRYPETASLRYLAPPAAVLGLLVGALLGLLGGLGWAGLGAAWLDWLLLGWLLPAGYLTLLAAGSLLLRADLAPAVRLRLPVVLAVMHVSWGAGFLLGLPRARG